MTVGELLTLSEDQLQKLQGYVVQADQFEQEGDPVSCRFWYRVCWAVQFYKDQCQRNIGCGVYRFLSLQEDQP